MILNFEPKLCTSHDLTNQSLLRMFLFDDGDNEGLSPQYVLDSDHKPITFPSAYKISKNKFDEDVACLETFNPLFESIGDVIKFENDVFLSYIKRISETYVHCIPGDFLSPEFFNKAFQIIEQHDKVVTNILISECDKDFFLENHKNIIGNFSRINTHVNRICGLWTADVFITDLLPSGRVLLMPSSDCLGAYFNRPLKFHGGNVHLTGAAITVNPHLVIVYDLPQS